MRELKRADKFELKSFFEAYVEACSLIRDEEDFAEILVAYLERVAE